MKRFGVVLLMTALAACYDEDPTLSSDVATGDIFVSVNVMGDLSGTSVRVALGGAVASNIELTGEDRLELRALTDGSADRRLAWDGGEYVGELPVGVEGFVLELVRADPHKDAAIDITVPPATELEAPSSASRAEPLVVSWTAAPSSLYRTTLYLEGPCFGPFTRELSSDAGTYTILPADLAPSQDTCEVTVTLLRAQMSQRSPRALSGAQISVQQIATTTLESTP